jgi:phenylalanyl-tRNA synthetase alpha subunit
MEQLDHQQAQTLGAIAAATTAEAVEAIRVAALGKQGWVSALLKTLGGMSPEERQAKGPQIHAAREAVTAALARARPNWKPPRSTRVWPPRRSTCRCPRPRRRAVRSTLSRR